MIKSIKLHAEEQTDEIDPHQTIFWNVNLILDMCRSGSCIDYVMKDMAKELKIVKGVS